jgi:hypothetical protein
MLVNGDRTAAAIASTFFVFVAAMYELSIYRQITLYNSIFNSYLLKYYAIKITVGS